MAGDWRLGWLEVGEDGFWGGWRLHPQPHIAAGGSLAEGWRGCPGYLRLASPLQLAPIPPSSPPALPAPQRRAEPRTPQLWGWGRWGRTAPALPIPRPTLGGSRAPPTRLRPLPAPQPSGRGSPYPKGFFRAARCPHGAGGDARAASPFLYPEGFACIPLGVSSLLPRPK